MSANGNKIEENDTKSPASIASHAYEEIKKKLQDIEFSLVSGASLSGDQLKFVQDRLYKMIDYAVKRHDWYVDQCHRLLQIGLALIATGAAVGAILVKFDSPGTPAPYLGWIFALALFGIGIRLVYLYNNYLSGDHPYRKVVSIRGWFFKYHFSEDLSPNLSHKREIAKQQVSEEADYIEKYFRSFVIDAKNPPSLMREDIEQVAILLILQRYRAQQVKIMASSLFKGLVFALIVFVLLIGSTLYGGVKRIRHSLPASTPSSSSSIIPSTTPSDNTATRESIPQSPSPTKKADQRRGNRPTPDTQ